MTTFIPSRKQQAAFVLSFCLLLLTLFASAQTTTSWTGIGGTGWTTASNWTNGVPTSTSDVIIGDANFTGTGQPSISTVVTINSLTLGGVKASTLTISRAITINGNVLINANGTFSDAGSGSSTTVKGDWTNNGVYTANSSQSIVFSGTNETISGSVATPFPTMSVGAGTTLTFATNFSSSGTVTVSGKLIPAPTAKLTSGSLSIASSGSIHVTGAVVADNYAMTPTLAAGSTVEYSGTINQTIQNFTYSHLRISGSGVKSLAANLTTFTTTTGNGNVYVDAATLDLAGFTMSRSTSGGIFSVAANATLRIGGTAAFPVNFATITLNAASTVEYYGTAQTIRAANYGNLTISGIRGSSSVTLANTGTIGVAGTLTASETYTTGSRIVTGSTVLFNGTTAQTVPSFTFNNLTINNSSNINLDADITVGGVLTFTAGKISTGANKVILPSSSSVSGAGQSTGWVNGNLQKYFATTAGGTFEIGDAAAYTSITVSFGSVTAAGSMIASTIATAHPLVGSSTIANNRISRYWTLSQPASGALGFTNATLTFNWTAADNYSNLRTANLMIAQHNGSAWSYPTVNTPTTTSIKATGISTVGSFTAGQACAANFSFAKSNFCSSDGTASAVIATGATAGSFSASPAGLSINSTTGAINLAASTAGTYTVTNTITGSCSTTFSTTVTVSTQPSATISYTGSPFCNSGTGTVTLSGIAGGTFSSTAGLSITASTGAINLGSSTSNTYTVTYTLAATAACPQFQTTTTVMLGPAIWKGTTSTDWSATTNWSCSVLPASTNDVVIPSGRTNYPVLASSQTGLSNSLTIQSGASLTVNTATLKIAGALNNSGTLTASNGATVEFNGTAAQTIPASVFTANTVYNLTNNNTVSLTLQGALDLLNVLSLKAGTFYTNGHLTLKSTADNTARLEQITSAAATPLVGDVTVERYVPGKRKYRLLAPSVTTSTSETLAAGQENLSLWAHWQNSGVTGANTGTLITGGTSADGFDTQTSTASLYSYNESTKKFVAFNSASGKKTKYTPLQAGRAYYMFVYGDRRNSISASSPNPTVLKAKGSLSMGNQVFTTTSATPISNAVGNYALIGNPYACPVDWKNVSKTGVSNTLWGWDANLNSTGGYVTVTSTVTGATVSPMSSEVQVGRYIQPGQGFFVRTTASSPQVTFTEASKVSTSTAINNLVFRAVNVEEQPLMAINLRYTAGGVPVLADGAVAGFHQTYSKEVLDEEDGLKMVNNNDGLSLSQGGTLLGIDNRPFPQSNDTLFISFSKLTKSQYTLEIFGQDLSTTTALPILQDTYLNTLTPLSLIDTNKINFSVTAADPASASATRFRIVFHQMTTLPVTFTSVAASKKDKQVIVDWKVSSETGIKKYQIERSANGLSFSKVGEVPARGGSETQSYQWLDASPLSGTNWYRIRSVEGADQGLYSKSVNVSIAVGKASVVVVPNPVKGRQINIQMRDMEKGIISAALYDQRGTEMLRRSFDHKGGTANYTITPGGPLASGIYYLKLMTNKEAHTLDIMIE